MKRIESKEALVKLFRELDQSSLFIPPDFEFPLGFTHSFSWTEPGGKRSFLVFEDFSTDQIFAVKFERSYVTGDAKVSMCDWCHRVGSTSDVHLYTARVNKSRTVGSYVCEGLDCIDRLDSMPSKNSMPETLKAQEKAHRISEKISRFLKSNLF